MNCWACNSKKFIISFENSIEIFCADCEEELTKSEIEEFLNEAKERLYYKKTFETEDEE